MTPEPLASAPPPKRLCPTCKIPLYPGVLWSFTAASVSRDPSVVDPAAIAFGATGDPTASYVGGLGAEFPSLPSDALAGARTDLATLQSGLIETRKQALVPNQLDAIVAQIQTAVAGGSAATADATSAED